MKMILQKPNRGMPYNKQIWKEILRYFEIRHLLEKKFYFAKIF